MKQKKVILYIFLLITLLIFSISGAGIDIQKESCDKGTHCNLGFQQMNLNSLIPQESESSTSKLGLRGSGLLQNYSIVDNSQYIDREIPGFEEYQKFPPSFYPYPYPYPEPQHPIYLDPNPDSYMVHSHYKYYTMDDIFNYEEPLEKVLIGKGKSGGTTQPPWDDYEADTRLIPPTTASFHFEDAYGDPSTGHCHLQLTAVNVLAQACHSHAYCWFTGSYDCMNTGDYYVNFNIDYDGIITTYDVILPIIGWGLDKKFEVMSIAGFRIADHEADTDLLYYKESFPFIGQYDIPSQFDEQPPLTIGYDEPLTLQGGYSYEFVVQFNLYLDSYAFSIGSTGGNIDLDCWLLEADITPRDGPSFVDLVASETIYVDDQVGYTIWTEPWYFEPGDDVTMHATIWNDGYHAAEDFRVAMGLMNGDGDDLWYGVSGYYDCPAGSWPDNTLTFETDPFTWPENTNTYYCWCYVDWYDDIDELSESNNLGIHPHRAQGQADIEIEELTLIQCDQWPPDIEDLDWENPESFEEGDRITPITLISNVGDGVAFDCDVTLYKDDEVFADGSFSLERDDAVYVYVVQGDNPGFNWPDSSCHTFRWEVYCGGDHEEEEDTYCPELFDTIPPDTQITSGPSGTIDYDDVTFQWTGSDETTPVGSLQYSYKLDGWSSWSSWTSSTSKSYSDLPEDGYTFRVKARDEAGNVDPSPATRSFTIDMDSDPPDTTITAGPSGTIDYNDVTFQWTGSDDYTPTGDLEYAYKLSPLDSSYSSWSFSTSKNYNDLENGQYTFYVKSRDQEGNEDPTPASRTFIVDVWQPHWIVFDDHEDSNDWVDETYAYDDNENTYARCPIDDSFFYDWDWTPYLELTFDSAKTCSKVGWIAWQNPSHCDRIEIKVYDNSAQVYSYEGEYTDSTWEDRTMGSSPKDVTSVKVKFRVRRTPLWTTVSPDLFELQMFLVEDE